jgi:hypothetical protein
MKNTIDTENGKFTINYVPKHYIIEMFDIERETNVLNVEYSSHFYRLEDEKKIENLFKELEKEIMQIMSFFINENTQFYKHFDIEFTLMGDSVNIIPREIINSNYFSISWSMYLKTKLKDESLEYLKGLSEEQKRNAFGFYKNQS